MEEAATRQQKKMHLQHLIWQESWGSQVSARATQAPVGTGMLHPCGNLATGQGKGEEPCPTVPSVPQSLCTWVCTCHGVEMATPPASSPQQDSHREPNKPVPSMSGNLDGVATWIQE